MNRTTKKINILKAIIQFFNKYGKLFKRKWLTIKPIEFQIVKHTL